jgi:putative copper export protein
LALTLIAAVVIIPLAIRRRRPPVALLAVGLGCGLLELAGREVPTAVPPDWPRTIFNTFLYVAHLWAAALWIGGLAALLSLAVLKAVPAEARRAFWPSAIRRFSTWAMVSVAAIVLSGLWLYWVHIDGVNQLVTTMYGRTLLVKLIVVAVLVLIGAANQFWLMPRIEAQQTAGDVGALNHTVGRHFRATIAVEVVLGLAVLFIAPLLGGSARNQAFQASPAALTQTEKAGDVQVALTPSGLQPGSIDYTIQVAGDAAPHQVTVSFGSTQLKVPPQAVVATALGGNKFRVTGFYTPVIGKWQAAVSLDNAAPASFTLPITAKPGKLPKSAAPDVRWTTWVFGIAETLLVVLVLISTSRISRMLSNRRPPSQPPATEPERDLVDA